MLMVAAVALACRTARMEMTSPAFEDGGAIPQEHTRDGINVSPELRWEKAPEGVRSFALICEDREGDHGNPWYNWVIFNIPAHISALEQGCFIFRDGTVQGTNSAGLVGYLGPGPPCDTTHHYVFRLYALDTVLTLDFRTTADLLRDAMRDHILDSADLTGVYGH